MLASIVARLLALADLGEDAAIRSPWVRFCVLWSLCQADAIIREFVAGSTWNPAGRLWSPALPMARYGTEPADAIALAASLRALALAVQAMAAEIGRLAFLQPGEASSTGRDDDPFDDLAAIFRRLATLAPVEFRDTS
ncbi:MAG: hypothetical protein M9939_10695 [Mesorhizobium sp.]|nr:hypothetical protein [Mesorhizobium sp.]MCO5161596.1 hypothetical protein [Mesorhizobium sp.]